MDRPDYSYIIKFRTTHYMFTSSASSPASPSPTSQSAVAAEGTVAHAFKRHEGSVVTLGLEAAFYLVLSHFHQALEEDPLLSDDIPLDCRSNLLLDAAELSGDSLWIVGITQFIPPLHQFIGQVKFRSIPYELPHEHDGVVGFPRTFIRLPHRWEVRLVDEFQRASPYNFTLELGAYPVAEARESIVKNALDAGVVLLLHSL